MPSRRHPRRLVIRRSRHPQRHRRSPAARMPPGPGRGGRRVQTREGSTRIRRRGIDSHPQTRTRQPPRQAHVGVADDERKRGSDGEGGSGGGAEPNRAGGVASRPVRTRRGGPGRHDGSRQVRPPRVLVDGADGPDGEDEDGNVAGRLPVRAQKRRRDGCRTREGGGDHPRGRRGRRQHRGADDGDARRSRQGMPRRHRRDRRRRESHRRRIRGAHGVAQRLRAAHQRVARGVRFDHRRGGR
mmetsp:Transcript_4836/g.18110  ORF Transcript_4836/g.18110 Transcript_4836/m.18110 type:complete len:242 (-) Transcript_4836:378-1103(-)